MSLSNKDALTKIKQLLGFSSDTEEAVETTNEVEQVVDPELSTEETSVETSFETAQVEGAETMVGVEGEWETGKTLYIITDEENIVAPEGSYTLVNGFTLVVDESGVITEITETETEVETSETSTAPAQEEMSSEDLMKNLITLLGDFKDTIESRFATAEATLEQTNTELVELKSQFENFKKQPAGKKITNSFYENIKRENNDQDFKFNKVRELAKKLNK